VHVVQDDQGGGGGTAAVSHSNQRVCARSVSSCAVLPARYFANDRSFSKREWLVDLV